MSDNFDPYYTWLAIPPEDQPPTLYRLLGLRTFEDDPEVIENVADQRMAYLRTLQSGKRSRQSQKMLNEISAARICLLNEEKRAEYDATLREQMRQQADGEEENREISATLVGFLQLVDNKDEIPAEEKKTLAPPIVQPSESDMADRNRLIILGAAIGGGVFVVLLLIFATYAFLSSGPSDQPVVEVPDEPLPAPPPPQPKPETPQPPDDRPSLPSTPPPVEPPPVEPPPVEPPPVEPPLVEPPLVEPPVEPRPEVPIVEPPPKEPTPPPATPPPATPEVKQPIPSAADQQQASEQLDQLYDESKATTPSAKLAMAKELFAIADESQPAEKFVILHKAAKLASDGRDALFMLDVIDSMARQFDMDGLRAKGAMLKTFADGATDSVQIKSLVAAAGRYADEALAAEQYEFAQNITTISFQTCQRSAGRAFRREAFDLRQQVQQVYEQYQKFQAATAALQADSSDAEANLAVGQWYCFVQGNWQQGLPHLDKGSDQELSDLAQQEAADPGQPSDKLDLGDRWWDAAGDRPPKEKNIMLLRAGHWYRQAMPALGGLERARVKKRLREIDQIEPAQRSGTPAAG